MANFKYDITAIQACVTKLNALAGKTPVEVIIAPQNKGEVMDKVMELVPKLNELHAALNGLITATATATQETMNQMIMLDEDFEEITEKDS